MILYPAIDLKEGACVRLLRGDMDEATIFNEDPADQARQFALAGFRWIHVVDLDGAFSGHPVNAEAVESIIEATDLPLQLGGGIRSIETIGQWLERGVSRVVLGTVALKNPELVREACDLFPGQIAVGIDARDGMVAVEGWAETSTMKALDLALEFEDCRVSAIIFTDIDRDGALTGPNVESTAELASALTTPVIASGGVTSLDDLAALKAMEHVGIAGVISGRALYDGRIDPKAALAVMGGEPAAC